jgi:predicted transcriptional regulator
VVVPFEDYQAAFIEPEKERKRNALTIPHDVVARAIKEQLSPIRAWREHLGLTQAEVASRREISQSAFAQMEAPDANPRAATLKKVATAMGITAAQLKW